MNEYLRPPQSENEPEETRLVIDEEYAYRGYYSDDGICRVRVYSRGENPPVLLFSELPENKSTSITNMIETLTPEVARMFFPHRFDYEDPFRVIEHYPGDPAGIRELRDDRYSLVEFADYKVRTHWLGGVQRIKIGQPTWTHLDKTQVEELVGLPIDDGEKERIHP